jgi:hypothetical protein
MTYADWEEEVGEVIVWPDNEEAYLVFRAMDTQWNHGFNGPTGLKYEALPEVWRRSKVAPDQRDDAFLSLRIMESAALIAMRKE